MGEYRSVDLTLASYRANATYDPSAWRVARAGGNLVGCVFGLPFPDSKTMELTYMGIVPEARGNSWGGSLIAEVVRMAKDRDFETVTLAVDADNEPAKRIYSLHGFKPFFGEAVWGRTIGEPKNAG